MIGNAKTGLVEPAHRRSGSEPRRGEVARGQGTKQLEHSVHVWLCHTDRANGRLDRLKAMLSPDERARSHRYRRDVDRIRFVLGRSVLRTVVAEYLGSDARALTFVETEHGKPMLPAPSASPPLEFNVTHSGDWVMVAVSNRIVGIDVEFVRPLADMDALAERLFAPTEVAALAALPPKDRAGGFFRCWTRKEAVVKALGTGLSAPLDRLEVGVAVGGPWTLRFTDDRLAGPEPWSLWSLEPAPGYAAAVAAAGTGLRLRCFAWSAPLT